MELALGLLGLALGLLGQAPGLEPEPGPVSVVAVALAPEEEQPGVVPPFREEDREYPEAPP